jgi:adenylate cyclase
MTLATAIHAIERRLIAEGTASDEGEDILQATYDALVAAGVPLLRASLGVPTLDPQVRGVSLVWRRGEGTVLMPTIHGADGEAEFRDSPIGYLTARGLACARWRLDGSAPHPDLSLLTALKAAGATDYLLHLNAFAAEGPINGTGLSFTTDRPGGFTEAERSGLAGLVPALALVACKLVLSHTLRETLGTYLGAGTGRRVLAGGIRRGQGTVVPAAILLADLRGFTALADREDPLRVVAWLDEHFEALGEPVGEHGGEILKFLGDGFLAVFPVAEPDAPACPACAGALAAARAALKRNAALNARRREAALPELSADIVLHYGAVVYGNVGMARRLDFTMIGPAVNEASRLEKLCEETGEPLLVSDAFAARCAERLRRLGAFTLRGVERAQTVWSLHRDDAG